MLSINAKNEQLSIKHFLMYHVTERQIGIPLLGKQMSFITLKILSLMQYFSSFYLSP